MELNPSEEWLVDNVDFVAEQSAWVCRTLTRALCGRLAVLKDPEVPRLLALCDAYLDSTDGMWDEASLIAFANAYQDVLPLSLAEAWVLPHVLRMALIMRLGHLAELVAERRLAEERVERFVGPNPTYHHDNAPPQSRDDESESDLVHSGPALAALVRRMRNGGDDGDFVRDWLQGRIGSGWGKLDAIVSYEHQLRTRYQVGIGNVIASLRSTNRVDWRVVFSQISVVEKTLLSEHSGIYARLDDSSRDSIRTAVEKIARRWRMSEDVIARASVTAANAQCVEDDASTHPSRASFVAYYVLEGEGLRQLRSALVGYASHELSFDRPGSRNERRYFGMLGSVFVLSLLVMVFAVAGWHPTTAAGWICVGVGCALPATEWTVAFVHWLVECTVKPIPLLRFDFSGGIPHDATTMMVIPVIWSSVDEVRDMAERLELHYASTRDPNVHYALLGDFSDSTEEHGNDDEVILRQAISCIQALNEKYDAAKGNGSTFHLFHRHRQWNAAEHKWMGWERKRGKLVEFVELLRGNAKTSYDVVVGEASVLPDVRYVITLDTDTTVPLGTAQRMIATIHLPYNRPRFNRAGTRVVEGYGILQPRVGVRYEAASRSWLARLWSGNPGIDPYAFALSDPYQDAFGQGIFTGKGIFDLDAFHRVLCPRIPDNRVLSHDLLEGGFLRAGLLSDIEVVDDYPATFASYQQRLHRWIRGDWQLIGWLRPRARNRYGDVQPVDLSVLTRWQIIDNLRRSLLHPALFFTLLFGLCILPGRPLGWVVLVVFTLAIPLIRHCASLRRLVRDPAGIVNVAAQTLVSFLLLPVQTALLLDAISRTAFRLAISKRNLLEWVSSAEVERQTHGDGKRPALHGLPGGYVLIGLFAVLTFAFGTVSERATSAAFCVLWALAPLYARWLDRPVRIPKRPLAPELAEELLRLAKETWHFYEHFAGEVDHYLPPDNVQIDPDVGVAHRTSPTNIGMLMASVVGAYDLEFLSLDEAIDGLEKTAASIEALEKWEGHLYNWYDTQTLAPLPPLYVSTVDSGNFVASLMVVRQALLEWSKTNAEREQRLWALADRLETLIVRTNFSPLFDHKAGLFTLGYHVANDEREQLLYDLFASESRQASFVAIALGQIPVSHWFTLNRTMTKVGSIPTLMSWSATMFEYLMPALFMRTYRGTLWDKTYQGVIDRQMKYAVKRRVPFGISESGYYAFDFQMNYQYRAFGVPGLGFKRGLEQDLVLAPYATALALPWALSPCLDNFRCLESLGSRGQYGFFEAVDCTLDRMPPGRSHMIIRSYMAHHQGMTLLSIVNVLRNDVMVERFHRDVRVKASELLLQERVPLKPNVIPNPATVVARLSALEQSASAPVREFETPRQTPREVCVLSNGAFVTMVDTAGGGFIQLGEVLINRWRDDPVAGRYGCFLYLRDVGTGAVWSPTVYPVNGSSAGRVTFAEHQAVFRGAYEDVETELSICVSPEWNADVRCLRLTNRGAQKRRIEITSFSELALTNAAADAAHPAFSKLFVETEYVPDAECLMAHRRKRAPKDEVVFAVQTLGVFTGHALGPVEYETNRASFIGRGNQIWDPQGIHQRLAGVVGAVTDPAFILRRCVEVEPGTTVQAFLITGIADNREDALGIVQRLKSQQAIDRTVQLAWNRNQIELRHLQLQPELAEVAEMLAARALFPAAIDKVRAVAIQACQSGQSGLWSIGISGDLPIVLMEVADTADLSFAANVIRCHHYLRRRGLRVDLIMVTASSGGYLQGLEEALRRTAERHGEPGSVGKPGGIFLLSGDTLPPDRRTLLYAVARVTLRANGPSLRVQLTAKDAVMSIERENRFHPANHEVGPFGLAPHLHANHPHLLQANGVGGFSEDGLEYQIRIGKGMNPPLPWSNVIANPNFGFLVTELGTGYTWWKNSRECKLTPWRNDPVLDEPSEVCYLRDEETGAYWSATPSPVRTGGTYDIVHGHGYTRFDHETDQIEHRLTMYVPKDDPVKVMTLRIRNTSDKARNLSVTYLADWVIGVHQESNRSFIVSEWLSDPGCLLARNTYQETFRDATAFLYVHAPVAAVGDEPHGATHTWTSDRMEFLGSYGGYGTPDGMATARLSGRTGVVSNACGAIRVNIRLQPGQTETVVILLGCAASREDAVGLVRQYQCPGAAKQALHQVKSLWHRLLGQLTVQTPSEPMNLMLNGWLLYQTLSCRIWARTGFYQAGGAFGFRDQLQDAIALLHTDSALTRHQILVHARHQFMEGDVEHWWHEETKKGIRTRFSDDLLWLPYAVGRYVQHTGDIAVLSECLPFLVGEPLSPGEDERYGDTVQSSESGTLYDHCVRAVDHALRCGEHGIPLMGSGDWNDGMNLVGPAGRGESVWLGWFLCDVLARMASVAEWMGDAPTSLRYESERDKIGEALNTHAWDGEWYRRAYTDAGTWMGSVRDQECRIDAIAQAWSVISGVGHPDKASHAMLSFDRELVDASLGIARLLTPAFDTSSPSPGYIQGYPPGIRENGGQYTHGVVWAIMAWAMLGEGDRASALFERLLPIHHTKTPGEIVQYQGEPYVMAADVYAHGPLAGRSGWTWYTGAAGWMYQVGIESILGIQRRGNRLLLRPAMASDWPGYSAVYRFGRAVYRISVERAHEEGASLTVDGAVVWRGGSPQVATSVLSRGTEAAVPTRFGQSTSRPPHAPEEHEAHVMVQVDAAAVRGGQSGISGVPEVPLVDDGKTHAIQLRWP